MKILLIIALVILAIRALTKNIYFSVYTDLHRRMKEDMNQYRERERKREGEVTIETKAKTGRNKNNDEGEYVDYTEIK